MDYIPSYAKRKAGSETPTYYTPVDKTKPYLEETYGIMVYQEQVMQVAQVVAGYSLGGADLLRRAMGKKIKAEMDAQKSKFVEGALATNGIHEREAVSIFESIEAFANYGFNKSHAAAYSVIAYHTAYLKAHHPVSFYAGLLSYEDKAERMALVKQDMDQFGIEFLSPDVNRSHGKFRAERREDGSLGLRFGLTAIKGVSESVVAPMVAERESGGPFKDLIDFHQRAGKHFNSAQLQKLAEAGAFVSVNPEGNRRQSFEILSFLSKNDKRDATMADIFGGAAKIVVRQNVLDTLEWNGLPDLEYNAVGFYFRSHPIDAVEKKLAKARLIKRRQTVIDFMVAKKEDYRRDINLLGMVEECFINQGSRGPFNKVKLGERQQTYMINIYPREQEVDEVHRLLEGAKKSRKPVVVRADFSPGHNGPGDMFVRGTKMWNLDQFLDEFNPPRRWGVEIDQSELDIRGDEAFRVGEIHARAKAGPPPGADPAGFEDDCMREMSEAVAPKMTFAMKMFAESFQSLSREVARESEADSVEITAVVRAGPYKRKFQFDKIIPPRYSITNNAVTAVACYAVTSFKEIE
jgi:DNA polymerase-3 subunit alpha